MNSYTLTLSWPEVLLAVSAGTMRHISAIKAGRADLQSGVAPPSWDRDIIGALAEMAVARYFGVFWSGTVGRIDLPDVGRIQVRSKKLDGDRLVIRPDDSDEQVFVSVLVRTPVFRLCGWLRAGEAKRQECGDIVSGRFFVPDGELHPMDALLRSDVVADERANANG